MNKAIKVLEALSRGSTVKVGKSVFRMKDDKIYTAMEQYLNGSPTGKKLISEDHRSMNDFIRKCESEQIKIK